MEFFYEWNMRFQQIHILRNLQEHEEEGGCGRPGGKADRKEEGQDYRQRIVQGRKRNEDEKAEAYDKGEGVGYKKRMPANKPAFFLIQKEALRD